ncbi:MAG: hypothetical protein IJ029_03475 [Lachnospiraceae bacterium]|nr:hypothetical protein [Lachnospiraceae bacterium]
MFRRMIDNVRKRRHSPSMAQSRLCLPSGQTIADNERNIKEIRYPLISAAIASVFPYPIEKSTGEDREDF